MSESLYIMCHPAPNRLRKKSRRAKPMRDVGMCELWDVAVWFFGRPLFMSTRHFLIRVQAGSYIRALGRFFLFLRLYPGAFVEPCDMFSAEVIGVALFSVSFVSIIPTVMVGTVVGAVCMGSVRPSMVCRVGKGPVS